MAQTPPSLLNRLREHPQDADAWQRFDALYRPLLQTWLRHYALQHSDVEDLVQQVLAVVVRELPSFQYSPERGTFRGWLRTILANRLREFWRARKTRRETTGDRDFYDQSVAALEDPTSDLSRLWEQEHDRHVARQFLSLIEHDFAPTTWEAFRRVMAGERAAAVAADLKLSINAVYLAKSSILKRLRQEMAGLSE